MVEPCRLLIHHRPCRQARDRRKPARNLSSSYRVIAVSIPALPNESGADRDAVREDCVGGSQFEPYHLHHPVLPKPQIPAPTPNRPFLWRFSLVSFRSFRLWRHFAVSQPDFSLASLHPKIPFPASGFSTARSRSAAGNFWGMEAKNDVSNPVHNYCGFNPRASNCWLHSAGASRSRSTPIPRGKRPSTAARTRSGARNASEIVMLT